MQKHFPLPSIPLLKKICSRAIDAIKCAQSSRKEGKISETVCKLFDEMYLQKCQEYFVDNPIGYGEDGNLYKGLVCFMNVGLKESVPYVRKYSPQTGISPDWLKMKYWNVLLS